LWLSRIAIGCEAIGRGAVTDIQTELLAAFDAEYREHLSVVRHGLDIARSGQAPDLKDMFRRIHSLKGAARAVDRPEVEHRAHDLEALLAALLDGETRLDEGAASAIEDALDAIAQVAAAAPDIAAEPEATETIAAAPIDLLRIDGARLAAVGINAQQVARAAERHEHLEERLDTIALSLRRTTQLLAPLLRAASPSSALLDLAQELRHSARQVTEARRQYQDTAWALDHSVSTLLAGIEALSLVTAETVFGNPARMLRDLAQEEGVEVAPTVEGLDLQADRRVLQALKDPVIQLLRNAASHGAEAPSRRRALGRPDAAEISLAFVRDADRLRVTVTDDGPGPDLAAIRRRAVNAGLISTEAAAAASRETILSFVFEAGFSTRSDADALAGRGLGLSIVAEAARTLRGTASLLPRAGGGTIAEINVPLSVARESVLLLDCGGGYIVGLPSLAVERLVRLPASRIERRAGHPVLRPDPDSADAVPLIALRRLLGLGGEELPMRDGSLLVVLLRKIGQGSLAIVAEALRDVRSMLVHATDVVGLDTELVEGFVFLERERPAMLLSPPGLITRWQRLVEHGPQAVPPEVQASPRPAARRTILVVDDSITTRTLEKSILEANGYHVLVAVDGIEGLEVLRSGVVVDMVLADIEMPRMDGFALLEAMRNDPALAAIPVIVMTSRAAAADIRRGLDLGANAYIAKQSFDQRDLLQTIGRLL
jgi:two-component system, chemotaxis family, sensor kinase CheA